MFFDIYCGLKLYNGEWCIQFFSQNVGSHAKLTDKDYLEELINEVQSANRTFAMQKPILLKIAPDLTNGQLDDILEIVEDTKIGSSPYDIFINNLNLLVKFSSTFMKVIKEMFVLIIFIVQFLTL